MATVSGIVPLLLECSKDWAVQTQDAISDVVSRSLAAQKLDYQYFSNYSLLESFLLNKKRNIGIASARDVPICNQTAESIYKVVANVVDFSFRKTDFNGMHQFMSLLNQLVVLKKPIEQVEFRDDRDLNGTTCVGFADRIAWSLQRKGIPVEIAYLRNSSHAAFYHALAFVRFENQILIIDPINGNSESKLRIIQSNMLSDVNKNLDITSVYCSGVENFSGIILKHYVLSLPLFASYSYPILQAMPIKNNRPKEIRISFAERKIYLVDNTEYPSKTIAISSGEVADHSAKEKISKFYSMFKTPFEEFYQQLVTFCLYLPEIEKAIEEFRHKPSP